MKTRVIRRYDSRNAVYVYWVQKFGLWDEPDLRKAYPDQRDWRFVRAYPELAPALETACRIAEHNRDPIGVDGHPEFEIVAEYDVPTK